GALAAASVAAGLRHLLAPGRLAALAVVLVAGLAGVVLYVALASRMRITELTSLTSSVRARLGR
ncbi:MAG: hypothetical protein M3Z02_06725, partial [Actinomycetota bacterium]|nr:hypothetical protein [Actinomycetota bacterium]